MEGVSESLRTSIWLDIVLSHYHPAVLVFMPTVYTENTEGGPPINAIIFANTTGAGLPDSHPLMTKIKVCCITGTTFIYCTSFLCVALYNSWFSVRILLQDLVHSAHILYSVSTTFPGVQHHFTPPSPNLYRPVPVPGQVSAYKFENDLSCPLNNRWESRVRVPSINSILALISEQKTPGLLRTLALALC